MALLDTDDTVGEAEAPLHLVHVTPSMLREHWELLAPELQRGCDESRGEFSLEVIAANLDHWPILAIINGTKVQAVMVTRVALKASGVRVLDCLVAAGEDADAWVRVDPQFDAFAYALGCASVRIPKARPGWVKKLPHWTLIGMWLAPREAHADFAPICVPYRGGLDVRRTLRWKEAGYMMEREI